MAQPWRHLLSRRGELRQGLAAGGGGDLCRRLLTGEAIHDLGKPHGTQHLGVWQCPGCGHAHLPHAVTCGPQQQGRPVAAVTGGPGRPQTPVSWLFTPSPPARDRRFPSTRLRSSWRSQAVPQTQGRPSSYQAAFNSQMPGIRSPAHTAAGHHSDARHVASVSRQAAWTRCHTLVHRTPQAGPHPPRGAWALPAVAPREGRRPSGDSQKLCLIVRFKQKRGKDCTQKLQERTSTFETPDVCQTRRTERFWPLHQRTEWLRRTCGSMWERSAQTLQPGPASPPGGSLGPAGSAGFPPGSPVALRHTQRWKVSFFFLE